MTAIEEPAPQLDTEAPAAVEQSDELEHWLRDLRTDATADPSGWVEADADTAVDAAAPPDALPETGAAEPRRVGRHRSAD